MSHHSGELYLAYVIEAVYKGRYTLVTLPCNVTPYRKCGQDLRPRDISKVGYTVTLQAFSVCCRYLAVTSKGWYGYGLSRWGQATWHVTTVQLQRHCFGSS